MKNTHNDPSLYAAKHIAFSRRQFLQQSAVLGVGLAVVSTMSLAAEGPRSRGLSSSPLYDNPLQFNGEKKDRVTGLYHLGDGYRIYNPGLMRFQACDSMSPFDRGGVNSYAYCLGDPVNQTDPSGHFAILSLIIGAIIGAVVGAAVSATVEGIRAGVTGTQFDWKQIGIGAALGFIGGGFGAAAIGVKTTAQVGFAVAEAAVSGGVEFGLNVASGMSIKDAGTNAGIGAVIGLVTFGIGNIIGRRGAKAILKAMPEDAIEMGSDFYLFKGIKGDHQGPRRLIISSHGGVSPEAGFTANSRLNYYTPHGKVLIDPGLDNMAENIFVPFESIMSGQQTKSYLLMTYSSDAYIASDISKMFNVDILTVKPNHLTSTKQAMKALERAGLDYDVIDMNFCRARTWWSEGFEAPIKDFDLSGN